MTTEAYGPRTFADSCGLLPYATARPSLRDHGEVVDGRLNPGSSGELTVGRTSPARGPALSCLRIAAKTASARFTVPGVDWLLFFVATDGPVSGRRDRTDGAIAG